MAWLELIPEVGIFPKRFSLDNDNVYDADDDDDDVADYDSSFRLGNYSSSASSSTASSFNA